jgi:hypothetical protein
MAPARVTHFVDYDAPGLRLARALCGTLVDRRTDHALTPTCPACAAEKQRLDTLEVG